MKIILADDHQLFREGVRTLLELDPAYHIVSEVDNTDALLEDVAKYQPDLIFQDYRMPGGGAISTLNKFLIAFNESSITAVLKSGILLILIINKIITSINEKYLNE